MRWEDFRRSENVEDRREEGGYGGGGGGSGMPVGAGGLSIGTVIVLGLIGWALGIDPRLLIGGAEIFSGGGQGYEQPQERPENRQTGAPSDQAGQFVAAILGDTEDRWKEIFQKSNQNYRAPRLVMYSGVTEQPCGGMAQAAMGPFYCPNDQRIYIDTSFFRDLEVRFRGCSGKACQFSQAYVISHEVGHHVQNLLGILPKVQQMQRGVDRREANHLQVQVELQADCFAGIWAHHSDKAKHIIEPGDVEAAMQTAAAIGDDRLQKQTQGRVVPDAFTHGSSAQRQRWFTTGLKSGTVSSCNTFAAAQL